LNSGDRDEASFHPPARTLAVSGKTHRLLQSMKLPERGVEIWQAHLDSASASEIEELRGLLDTAEKERAEKFYRECDRARFIVAHGLLRLLLSCAIKCSTAIEFTCGKNGKPSLANDAGLEFNLSHCADWAVFALAWKRQVGIDLESAASVMRNPRDLPGMAERIFSHDELTAWQNLPDEQTRTAAFLRAWTRKEACIKAAGLKLDDVRAIETGVAITSSPKAIIIPGSHGDSAIRLRLHDLSGPIPPRPATAVTTCALAVEV
jgi:phosphopantetheine--protein transferase-like protein